VGINDTYASAGGTPADFIGRGWSFPLGVSATGGIALSSGDDEISESIRLILGTARGERPMRPLFGCGIHDFVFSAVDISFAGSVQQEVRDALERWEPRIDVGEITVIPDEGREGVVLIGVEYTLKTTNDRRNLVFPFYTIPWEG
jgi:phage baseplate assembly protein W